MKSLIFLEPLEVWI